MLKRLTIVATGLALAVTLAPASSATTIDEDSPRFNCHTMGNHDCGDSPVIKVRRGGKALRVAVLATHENGSTYGSARSGRVIKLHSREVAWAWRACVRASDHSDAQLHACDTRFGEHDMRRM